MATLEMHDVFMTDSTAQTPTFDPPQPGDPRYSYAMVTMAVRELMQGVADDQMTNATPCPEFTVKELLEHIVLVHRRVAAIGRGEHWSSVQEEPVDAGWLDHYNEATHAVMTAWADPAKLQAMYEVPWATMPGMPLMWTYAGELAVHAWDLAQATAQPLAIDDDVLRPALEGARGGLPAEGRSHPDMPFTDVVDPGPDAAVLLQLAGWLGRNVLD